MWRIMEGGKHPAGFYYSASRLIKLKFREGGRYQEELLVSDIELGADQFVRLESWLKNLAESRGWTRR